MQTEYRSQSQVPSQREVPFETRQAVIEQRLLSEHADVKRVGEQATKMKLILQEYRDQLIDLMGSSKYEQFRAYVADQKRFQAKFFFPPRGPEMSQAETERFRRERREESQAFLYKLGLNVDQIKALSKRVRSRMEELAPPPPMRDGKLVTAVMPSDVPPDIRAHKTNPWTIVYPNAGWGWAWGYEAIFNAGFTFNPTLHLDAPAGLVGNINQLIDSDASDNDVAVYAYTTLVGFWYLMPRAGLITVWLEAVPRSCHHHLSLIDEFGWSDSQVTQRNLFALRATVGGAGAPVYSQSCWFQSRGETSGYWDEHYFTIGDTYWHNLVSAGHIVFPAGAWVLVEVGTQNWNSCFANDVEVYSTMDFAWFIKSVHIDSTGA